MLIYNSILLQCDIEIEEAKTRRSYQKQGKYEKAASSKGGGYDLQE